MPGGVQVKDDPALAGLSAKDITKRVMPFVQFRMKEAQRAGKQVRGSHAACCVRVYETLASPPCAIMFVSLHALWVRAGYIG